MLATFGSSICCLPVYCVDVKIYTTIILRMGDLTAHALAYINSVLGLQDFLWIFEP